MKEEAARWLMERGLDPALAEKMGWAGGTGKDGNEWLTIPYVRDGKVVTTQYRRLDKKEFRFAKGSEVELWNADCLTDPALDGYPLVITEGALDGLAAMQCGFKRVVGVPGWGESNSDPDKSYAPFKRHEELIKKAAVIIAASDNDNTGRTLLYAIANFFEDNDVCYVTLPEGCKDVNDVLREHGPQVVVEALSSARSLDPKGGLITGFSDLPPRPERQMWKVGDEALEKLDKVFAIRTREISVLTGIPGHGKTTMLTWLCDKLVQKHDIRIGLGLFETDATEVLDQVVRMRSGGKHALSHLKHPEFNFTSRDLNKIASDLDRNYRVFHRVEDDEDTPHGMLWLKQMIHKLAARDGCNIIVIDPWNELEHMLEPGESMTNYINLALMRLRQWADRYDVHICVVAHPRKMGPGETPTGYHIADSAAFFNKPGMGWTVAIRWTKGNPPKRLPEPYVLFRCWKVRNRQETGCRPGDITFKFCETAMNYTPWEAPAAEEEKEAA